MPFMASANSIFTSGMPMEMVESASLVAGAGAGDWWNGVRIEGSVGAC